MNLKGLLDLLRGGRLAFIARMTRSSREAYRVCFLARAAQTDLLVLLGRDGATFEEIALKLATQPERRPALRAYLDLGVGVGELGEANGRYVLRGRLAKTLARPGNDAWRAMAVEVAGLHVPYILGAPGDDGEAERLARLSRSFSPVIARSSRILEPLLKAVTAKLIPRQGRLALLEVGCGSGVYVLEALRRNPELTVTAVEREPDVALAAREAFEAAGFGQRVRVVNEDVRSLAFDREFDLITLHNNIYYFPKNERARLLADLKSWLKPGGRLAMTTPCPGGGLFTQFMMLWSTATAGAGELPDRRDFTGLMEEAGYVDARADQLVPFDSYTLFTADNPIGARAQG